LDSPDAIGHPWSGVGEDCQARRVDAVEGDDQVVRCHGDPPPPGRDEDVDEGEQVADKVVADGSVVVTVDDGEVAASDGDRSDVGDEKVVGVRGG